MNNSLLIWGPSKENIKQKITRKGGQAIRVDAETIHLVPSNITANHNRVYIGIDIIMVNGLPFIVSIGTVLHCAMVTGLKDMKIYTLISEIEEIVTTYRSKGFNTKGMTTDNGFEPLKPTFYFSN